MPALEFANRWRLLAQKAFVMLRRANRVRSATH
jgi:hypothetical protein